MEKRRARGVLLDYCPSCSAIWLDGGELDALRTGPARSESELAEQEREESAHEEGRAVTVSSLCPRCQRRMRIAFFGDVEVNRCDGCGGLYFDEGELPAVLAAQRAGPLERLWARIRGR